MMRRTTKLWLLAAGALVLAGYILFAGTMAALGWDFSKLSVVQFETNTYPIGESFRDIAVTTDTADIAFAASADGTCSVVVCEDAEHAKHTVTWRSRRWSSGSSRKAPGMTASAFSSARRRSRCTCRMRSTARRRRYPRRGYCRCWSGSRPCRRWMRKDRRCPWSGRFPHARMRAAAAAPRSRCFP